MYKFQQVRVVRSLVLASLGAVVVAGLIGVDIAGASPEHHSTTRINIQGTLSNFDGHGSRGHDHGHRQYVLRGQVTAVSATSVTIAGKHDASLVLTITPTTTFTVGSTTTTVSSLAVGERVEVTVSPTAPSTATQIDIHLSRVEGLVSAVSATTMTLAKGDAFTFTVAISPTTTFSLGGATAVFSSVTVGTRVEVQGIMSADHTTFNAMMVTILNSK